jgi:prefoldin subunit 5
MAGRIGEQIESLEDRLRKLKARKQKSDAHKRTVETRKARRDDTRRKILIGAIVLAKIDQGAFDRSIVIGWLDDALTREDDRNLFGLRTRSA